MVADRIRDPRWDFKNAETSPAPWLRTGKRVAGEHGADEFGHIVRLA